MPVYEGLTPMLQEKELIADLIDFNNKYATYLRCNEPNAVGCRDVDKSIDTVYAIYNKINNIDLQNLIESDNKNNINNVDINLTSNDIVEKRKLLDDKMKKLYDMNLSTNDVNIKYNSTIYSSMLWTILASSLIYYAFTKI